MLASAAKTDGTYSFPIFLFPLLSKHRRIRPIRLKQMESCSVCMGIVTGGFLNNTSVGLSRTELSSPLSSSS
ncbi:UvrABC system C [Gossypium arboreum]|uniref:UvrABC system C n=1 Tax=Gossypium arboreum TaxID=29729 RepID=A0A0B0MP47_GOSAR|nr:UvrABC system C [Gossypium arboreum]KHG27427.1 UvrABC system C [Gossypium arboreum]